MIILVDEDESGSLLVCTTTSTSIYTDKTTQLRGGCHPDLPRDCTVDYDSARYLPDADVLRQGIRDGLLRTLPSVLLDQLDLGRIRRGLSESPFTNAEAREYAKRRGII